MSRHYLACEQARYFAVAGWDSRLRTFFAQIIDREKLRESEREKPAAEVWYDYRSVIYWRGVTEGELPRVTDLEHALSGHASLSEELKLTLSQEQETGRQST
jgi:hypothetical protein